MVFQTIALSDVSVVHLHSSEPIHSPTTPGDNIGNRIKTTAGALTFEVLRLNLEASTILQDVRQKCLQYILALQCVNVGLYLSICAPGVPTPHERQIHPVQKPPLLSIILEHPFTLTEVHNEWQQNIGSAQCVRRVDVSIIPQN